ncbi:MAG TPA: DinB family protein [Gemmatimonadaceae bacterium]
MSVFTNPAGAAAEHARAYVAAILGLLGDKDPRAVLGDTSAQLRRLVESTPPDVLMRSEAPAKWSMGQVVAHLADSDLVWGWRLRLILSQDRPSLTGYDQDAWADRLGYSDINPDESLELFDVLRRSNLALVNRASPDDLQRVGVHVERGDESLAHQLKLYAGHDLLHLNQLQRIRAALA